MANRSSTSSANTTSEVVKLVANKIVARVEMLELSRAKAYDYAKACIQGATAVVNEQQKSDLNEAYAVLVERHIGVIYNWAGLPQPVVAETSPEAITKAA